LVVFNLHRVVSQGKDRVVVVEGFFDCMKVVQAGIPCVALMGWSLSEEQAKLLSAHFRYLTIMLDGDEAGRKGTAECLLALGRRRYVRAVAVPEGMEPDQLGEADIRALLWYE
jgi:DNA primase